MKKEVYKHSDGFWYFDLNWEEKTKHEWGTLIRNGGFHSIAYKNAKAAAEEAKQTALAIKEGQL